MPTLTKHVIRVYVSRRANPVTFLRGATEEHRGARNGVSVLHSLG